MAGNSSCILYTPHPRGPPAGNVELQASRPFACPCLGRGLRLARSAGRGRTLAAWAVPCDAESLAGAGTGAWGPSRASRGPCPRAGALRAAPPPLTPFQARPGAFWPGPSARQHEALRLWPKPKPSVGPSAWSRTPSTRPDSWGVRGEESKKDISRLRARAREGCFSSH